MSAGARKRWPRVLSPNAIFSPPRSTAPATALPAKTHSTDCSGRTQMKRCVAQRIDFGHGKLANVETMIDASKDAVGCPLRCSLAMKEAPLGPSTALTSAVPYEVVNVTHGFPGWMEGMLGIKISDATPMEPEKPATAVIGAS